MRAVILVRASSPKQISDGDSLEHQLAQCRQYLQKQTWEETKVFSLVESGASKEREFFQEVLAYATDTKNKIDVLVFKHINRFTRGGGVDYLKWKKKLSDAGVRITDIYSTIGQSVNTLDHLGFDYEWSTFSPSEPAEIEVAEQAKADRRNILTQTIGAEITYTQMGYWCKPAPYGFKLEKVDTPSHGKRVILVENPSESFYVRKVFELRAKGHTVGEITTIINDLGYKSRLRHKRDKRDKRIIDQIGGKKATNPLISALLERTHYAGVICQEWTKYQPVKAKFSGFISIDLFNRANKGKIQLDVKGDKASIRYGDDTSTEATKTRRNKNNPLYPFKNVLKCPKCKGKLKGSASTGRSGTRFPSYHCDNGHKRWSLPVKDFEQPLYEYVKQIKFDEGFSRLLEALFFEEWDKKQVDVMEESKRYENEVLQLVSQQKQAMDNLKATPLDKATVRQMLMEDIEDLQKKLDHAREVRDSQIKKEIDVKLAFKYGRYFMEHMEELLIDRENVLRQQQLFAMMFEELPTHDEIVNGTAKLNLYFKLNKERDLSLVKSSDLDRNRTGDLLRDREAC
ncbi:MAG TPA: recombinase family protein, partial [Patescibacteria group bacterium]